MDVVAFLTKLASADDRGDNQKYWRVIVNYFLANELKEFNLGALPGYFKQNYGRVPMYDGKLSVLLQEPEFKAICRLKNVETTVMVYPSITLQSLCRQNRANSDEEELNSTESKRNNNTNIVISANQNPFAALAKKELEKSEQNYEARFGQVMLEELNCGICFDLLKEAVEGNCCRNLFCMPCIEQNGRKCPNCRKVVEWTANEPIRRLIGKKPVQCDYEECQAWSTIGEIDQHRVKCEFNPENMFVKCQKCHERILRKMVEQHLRDTCTLASISCKHCSRMVVRNDLENHYTTCTMVKTPCQLCGLMVPRKGLEQHLIDTCAWIKIPCRHCALMIARKDYDQHLNNICEKVKVPCNSCGELVLRKSLAEHEANTCEYRRVSCAHGCGEHMAYTDYIDSHANTCSHQLISCTNEQCNTRVQRRLLDAHLDVCKHSILPCPHAHQGCNATFTRATKVALTKHAEVCEYKLVRCPHGCNKGMLNHKLKSHKCEYMPEKCPTCKDTFKKRDLQDHMENCPLRQIKCPNQCGTLITAMHVEKHLSNCPVRRVQCLNCETSVVFRDMDEHLAEHCPYRTKQCEKCQADVYASAVDFHESESCPKRLKKCGRCKEDIVAEAYDFHTSYECVKRIVSCRQCDKSVTADLFAVHLENCPLRQVECPDCKSITYASNLSLHKAKRCPRRLVTCELCEEQVEFEDLEEHKEDYCPERCVQCNWCKKYCAAISLSLHKLNCRCRPVHCPDCRVTMHAHQLQSHQTEKCSWRQVSCTECHRLVVAHYLDEHSRVCPEGFEWCEYCAEKMRRSHSCPDKPRLCTICFKSVLSKDYKEHIESCGRSSCTVS